MMEWEWDFKDLPDLVDLSPTPTPPRFGPSRSTYVPASSSTKVYEVRDSDSESSEKERDLAERIDLAEAEIDRIDDEMKRMKSLRAVYQFEIESYRNEMLDVKRRKKQKGKQRSHSSINYDTDEFEWSDGLLERMKDVFKIKSFRHSQRGVCNANMDGRDIVCVMPTGKSCGGKSLTYQLPALLQNGCTLVISPLISLISDQIFHLRSAGIDAVKLTGATPESERKDIHERLERLARNDPSLSGKEIKLCYVTPEKLVRSKHFRALIQRVVNAGKLARIVIDEAHCVSQLGHDFRPDYKELRTLRRFFPKVPIMALSATCPPRVLKDLLTILGLEDVVDGNNVCRSGTIYFSSPLYRKNLHYTVLPKPEVAKDVIKEMYDYIQTKHSGDTGIIYCLRQKDSEEVAKELQIISGGKIKTGVYHAGRSDIEKEKLHIDWREGRVKVVCATIAFGLGIDKANVRFVLHHSISSSIEGYYQESGRAGRDGLDADCVLYYRPQDATSLLAITSTEKDSKSKIMAMLSFAENLVECRKILFAKYFSVSSQLDMSSWTTQEVSASAMCGHCDNCTRSPETIEEHDITLEAWRFLKITKAIHFPLPMKKLVAISRGAGMGTYELIANGRKTKETIDLQAVAGGPIKMKPDAIEHLFVYLLTNQFLAEKLHPTAHTINVYIILGPKAPELLRETEESLKGTKTRVTHWFLKRPKVARPQKKSKNGEGTTSEDKKKKATQRKTENKATGKRKRATSNQPLTELLLIDSEEEKPLLLLSDDEMDEVANGLLPSTSASTPLGQPIVLNDDNDSDDGGVSYGWSHSLRMSPPATHHNQRKRSRLSEPSAVDLILLDSSD